MRCRTSSACHRAGGCVEQSVLRSQGQVEKFEKNRNMDKCRDAVEERGVVDHSRWLGLVSATLCKLQWKQPAVFSRTHVVLHCCINQNFLTLSPYTASSSFWLLFYLTQKLRAHEQKHLSPWCCCQDSHRSAGARWAMVAMICPGALGLGGLWEPAWILQACRQAATLPCAGVCGAVLRGGWVCHSHVWGVCAKNKDILLCSYVRMCLWHACMYYWSFPVWIHIYVRREGEWILCRY